ncbi:alpha/beta hydrolase [Kitasatospora sp. NPDC048286]|uniref:alpha/beta hydrolase n=1 Tax=Kitasatospora sp. NPDC048286 TaxID=3364047 RepID=UPI003719AE64
MASSPRSPAPGPPAPLLSVASPPSRAVGTTGDAATPYQDAKSLASQLPGGMLLTYRGLGHTAYGRGNACVTEAVDGYLVDLKPVSPDASC